MSAAQMTLDRIFINRRHTFEYYLYAVTYNVPTSILWNFGLNDTFITYVYFWENIEL